VISLPTLSDADPEIAGEGSLDPLGLAPIADRLAEMLVPDVRARMHRIRFVTAIAVGAVVSEGLWDEPPADGVSTPAICFEWVVLESFVRKAKESGALEATGVPGSAKAQEVIAQGKRLTAANYLKTPSVFGFNGVYQPLARGLRVVDGDRMAAERTMTLVTTWENEQGFAGFVDRRRGSEGVSLRVRLREAVSEALRSGRCSVAESAHLWSDLARSLPPLKAGPRERALLRSWLLDTNQPTRFELARVIAARPFTNEAALLKDVKLHVSESLRSRIDAVFAYERFCSRLDVVLTTLRHISTLQGAQPVTPASATNHPVIKQAARELPEAYRRVVEAVAPLDLAMPFEQGLGTFGDRLNPAELAQRALDHHSQVQRAKNKRNWFEPYANGVVVRPQYRRGDPVSIDDTTFLHPFRVAALWQFMQDTRP
jgi:hypothetical protein